MKPLFLLILVNLIVAGCATQYKSADTPLTMSPANEPAQVGSYDFDFLGPVEGKGCVKVGQTRIYDAHFMGISNKERNGPAGHAIVSAAFDALSKIKGADSILISRIVANDAGRGKVCAHLWGRAVRFKKGPPIVPAGGTLIPPEIYTDKPAIRASSSLVSVATKTKLPESLSAAQIVKAFESIEPQVRSCATLYPPARGKHDPIKVSAIVAGTGVVDDVIITHRFAKQLLIDCIERLVMQLEFPKFSSEKVTLDHLYAP